jgi:hypothetical protein
MALSDPTNVRIGLARKQELLQKLAAQMAAKGGARAGLVRAAGGRAMGTGSQFASAVNLRTGGPARVTLPFDLPTNRMRPAGFDPDQSGGNAWAAPQALDPVIPSGPPAGGGTATAVDPTATAVDPTATGTNDVGLPDNTTYANLGVDPAAGWTGGSTPAGTISAGSAPNIFGDPNNPYNASAPLNQAAPDPYTLMATAQMQRIMRGGAMIAV